MADKKSSLGASALNQISQFNAGVIDSTLGLLDLGAQGVAGVSNMITGRNDSPVMLSGRAKSALNIESNPNSVGYVAGSVAPAIATGVGAMAKQGVSSMRNFLGGSTAELGGYYGGEAGAQIGRVYGGTAGEIVGGLAGGIAAPNAPRPQAIDAWHGSPHEFEKFSMDKMGTGEGAQAYGDGLYFAERRGIGEDYRNKLSGGSRSGVQDRVYADGSEVFGVEQEIGRDIADGFLSFDEYEQYIKAEPNVPQEYKDALESLRGKALKIDNGGALYNVNLNVGSDELLNWDASLAEQSPKVRNQIESMLRIREPDGFFINPDGTIDQDVSGRMIYDHLAEIERDKIYSSVDVMNKRLSELSKEMEAMSIGNNQFSNPRGYDLKNEYERLLTEKVNFGQSSNPRRLASNRLKENGIFGIQYLDGSSRTVGEGTSNYVIFDDSLVDTKRVNDKLTPSWMDQGARMQRAQEGGFDLDRTLYHYTDKLEDGEEFTSLSITPENVQTKLGRGIYTSPDNQYGDRYIRQGQDMSKAYGENARAIPVYARGKIATEIDYETAYRSATENLNIKAQRGVVDANTKLNIRNNVQDEAQRILKDQGFTGAKFMDEVMIFDPKDVRSVNAEFDPTKADSADLLSSRQSERQMSALRGIA